MLVTPWSWHLQKAQVLLSSHAIAAASPECYLFMEECGSSWELCQQSSRWCAAVPVSRGAPRAGASLEPRSAVGRRESRVEVSLCHRSAAPTWGWLGSLLLPGEEIRLRGHMPGQREKQHVLLVCQTASWPARKHRLPDFKWLENTYILYLETPLTLCMCFQSHDSAQRPEESRIHKVRHLQVWYSTATRWWNLTLSLPPKNPRDHK